MKIRVGVFFGGKSVEHEVSVISALQACRSLNTEKYEIIPIYITKNTEFYIGEKIGKIEEYRNIPALLKESERVLPVGSNGTVELLHYPMKKFGNNVAAVIDVALPVVHGTNVEDGALQGYLQTLGIPYASCDVLSSAVGMDKYVMKCVFADNGIPVLPGTVIDVKRFTKEHDAVIELIESRTTYPVIVKPVNLGSSVGIRKAKDRTELEDALDYAFTFAIKVLVENAITELKEINCSVLGDYEEAEASECEQPISNDDILSFNEKYIDTGKNSGMASLKRKIPADITPEQREQVRAMAVKAFRALGCLGVARIDFMLDMATGKIYLNEINTIPGSLAFYLWKPVGVNYPELLDRLITLAFKRERENKSINFSFDSNILENASFGGAKGAKGAKV